MTNTATVLNRDICVVVGGAGDAKSVSSTPQTTTLFVVINGKQMPETITVGKVPGPQVVAVALTASEDATDKTSGFWRDVLRGAALPSSGEWGQRTIAVGVTRGATTIPPADQTMPLVIVATYPWAVAFGALAVLGFAASFISLARTTNALPDSQITVGDPSAQLRGAEPDLKAAQTAEAVLRNRISVATAARNAAKQDLDAMLDDVTLQKNLSATEAELSDALSTLDAQNANIANLTDSAAQNKALVGVDSPRTSNAPLAPYSLAKSQMAVWLFLTTTGFIFIWLGTGEVRNVLTAETLTLLGISGTTGIIAVQMDSNKGKISRSFLSIYSETSGLDRNSSVSSRSRGPFFLQLSSSGMSRGVFGSPSSIAIFS